MSDHAFLALLINIALVAVAVLIHFEFLTRMTNVLPKLNIRPRSIVLVGIFIALMAHSLEIILFGTAYYLMTMNSIMGYFTGAHSGSWFDCVYYSFTSYTTLGFGDIAPMGHIRFLTGLESLTGLVLIT